jgi:Sulfatase-modifying factor enzyme 1
MLRERPTIVVSPLLALRADQERALTTSREVSQNCKSQSASRTFRMGSDHHYPEEAPAHRVVVDKFWIDRTPVTNAAFRRFVNATGYVTFAEIKPDARDYPGTLPQMLKAGSLVFTPPKHAVDLGDWSELHSTARCRFHNASKYLGLNEAPNDEDHASGTSPAPRVSEEASYFLLLCLCLCRSTTTSTRVLNGKAQGRRATLVLGEYIRATLEKGLHGRRATRTHGAVQRGDAALVQSIWVGASPN